MEDELHKQGIVIAIQTLQTCMQRGFYDIFEDCSGSLKKMLAIGQSNNRKEHFLLFKHIPRSPVSHGKDREDSGTRPEGSPHIFFPLP